MLAFLAFFIIGKSLNQIVDLTKVGNMRKILMNLSLMGLVGIAGCAKRESIRIYDHGKSATICVDAKCSVSNFAQVEK